MITKIEEMSLNTWPALQTYFYDCWIIRFANGVTRRANSINPIYFSTLTIREKINYCQDLYHSLNLKTRFKLTTNVFPKNLDQILADIGYVSEAPTSVQTSELKKIVSPPKNNIQFKEEKPEDWLDYCLQFYGLEISKRSTYLNIITQISGKKSLLALYLDQEPVACGLGVLDQEYLWLFDLVVSPSYRKQGLGEFPHLFGIRRCHVPVRHRLPEPVPDLRHRNQQQPGAPA